ncbi:MAG TPA: hypothetical protein VE991_05735 [Acidimicrobiales bacterium]|nr:hypothetical protein [Acidimicrobiales bacterium]
MARRPGRDHRTLGLDYAHRWARQHPSVHGRVYPRVLVEAADGADALARVRVLESHGYDAVWCPGPHRSDGRDCPLVRGDGCPLADEVEVVATSLDLEQPGARAVLEAMTREHPELPVVVETTRAQSRKWVDLLTDTQQVHTPVTAESFLRSVARSSRPEDDT